MKCSSEDSFESCFSTFKKVPHTSSAVLLSDISLTKWCHVSWMERGDEGSCHWSRAGPVLGKGFLHVVEISNLHHTGSQKLP